MTNKQELIDQYHSGQMSPEQMIDFEKELATNPELKAESDFQSDIIEGLKEVRKTQLKSRLNAIDVSSGWVEFAQHSTLVKSFGGVVIATLIGSGVYFMAEKPIEKEFTGVSTIEINAPEPQDPELAFDLIVKNSAIDETIKNIASPSGENITKNVDLTEEPSKNREVPSKSVSKAIAPDFSAPSAGVVEDNSNFKPSDLDALPEVTTPLNEKIDVSTENVNSINIKYKYYDGKLFLSGDFDRAPYEILEINSASGRKIYIQYLNTYYQVETTDKLSSLPEVTDQKLIKKLKLLKENK